MQSKKGNAGNIALNNLERGLTNRLTNKPNSKENRFVMNNNNPKLNNFQLDLFTGSHSERPKKTLEIIHCCDCRQHRELDGYRFGLMPLCSECRTEREVAITGNRFERRRATR